MRFSYKALVKSFLVFSVIYWIYLILGAEKPQVTTLDSKVQEPDVICTEELDLTTKTQSDNSTINIYPDPKRTSDDRILSQMIFIPESVKDNNPVRDKVLLYHGHCEHPTGKGYFQEQACAVKSCELTTDIERAEEADVVVFSGRIAMTVEPRHPWQIWVLYALESPEHTFYSDIHDHVNWTATYRHDSTLVTPYEKYVPLNKSRLMQSSLRNYAAGKTKLVAWFVSNCRTPNRRAEYVDQLSRYVEVDIYGFCGDLECPRGSEVCSEMLNTEYKFYLAFENSNCRDYITEKFFVTGLQHDVVPVVMGAAPGDYRRVAPPHSFIHVDEFNSAAELGRFLRLLDRNDDAYNSYFRWKGLWKNIDTLFPCRLCALAHDVKRRGQSWYRDFKTWWRGPRTCIGYRHWKERKRRKR